jgi:acetylornithine deacetylase
VKPTAAAPGLDATIGWLDRLVAQPTVAGRSNEQLVNDVATYLEGLGAEVTVARAARDDAANLHAVIGPADVDGGVMLCAHTDVVDVAGQSWTRDPFNLKVVDGRAYGRGAVDMKGFLAATLAALGSTRPHRLRRPLWLALSSDEEIGCVGVRPLLDLLENLPHRPAWALVGEPTSLQVVDRHKGKAAVRVEIQGQAAHSSLPHKGANAVAYAGRLITRILERQREIADGEHDPSFQVPHTTLGIGPIAGGVALNIIPDHCRLDLEVRTVPGDDPQMRVMEIQGFCAELEQHLRLEHPQTSIAVTPLSGYPGLEALPAANVDWQIAAACGPAPRLAVDFGTEAGLYQQRLGIPVVVCGPGSMDDAHGADESVALDQLRGCTELVSRLLGQLSSDRDRIVKG